MFNRLLDIVPAPNTRGPLTVHSFAVDFLPSVLLYYVSAVLVILPGTFLLRLALLPFTLYYAFHAATTLDIGAGFEEEARLTYLSHGLCLAMVIVAFRALEWTFAHEPYIRKLPPYSPETYTYAPSANESLPTIRYALWNAIDLFFNLRGCGWNWPKGLKLPREKRPINSKSSFCFRTLVSLLYNILLFDCCHFSVQSFSPSTIGSPAGGTIFDPTLPPHLRYLRSTLLTWISGFTIYLVIQSYYDFITLVGVIVFQQHPTQWPPLFDTPWFASSLKVLWARRWHQAFRQSFICVGSKPFSFYFGRIGGVMGAFFVSGVLHDWGMWGMGKGSEFLYVGGFFLMMGAGVVLEETWKSLTGLRVIGFAGWLWTMLWITGWANLLLDAWSRRGLLGCFFMPEAYRPSLKIVGAIMDFLRCL